MVGWVDTHGRAETEALLAGLEVLPRRSVPYRGTTHGALNNTQASGTAGAMAVRLALQPGASRTAVFALAWHMPHLLAAECKWDHLVRASSAPPPPTSLNRRDYGHAYHQWFQDSWTVAEHGLQEWSNIRNRVLTWQSALTNSSLPSRFALALCNDLCALVSNRPSENDAVTSGKVGW